ncbi:MAG: DNA internalization-related competence protein ComEC/Rec2 [Candidatus Margulisbacteria bacterium GWF2_38_17]|nr:MAG: DNA internalization-related competence protein ComEC/Rec2 [Candidatus Margulisbacteria bacterium GWD2_39_127]OGI04158.1 MAG: DNA internalization-related competence protein ComEC/Rec2 [Candidatus Margulisbacteria bacterium GWF2_38_17]OGI09309.1 MAG: DNA internalization-related competence protein ComEC/Rec2 [Candidatus Margulisbacteria bacterium GWE2_39_32]
MIFAFYLSSILSITYNIVPIIVIKAIFVISFGLIILSTYCNNRSKLYYSCIFICLGLTVGFYHHINEQNYDVSKLYGKNVEIRGIIITEPQKNNGNTVSDLVLTQVNGQKIPTRKIIKIVQGAFSNSPGLHYGDVLIINGKLCSLTNNSEDEAGPSAYFKSRDLCGKLYLDSYCKIIGNEQKYLKKLSFAIKGIVIKIINSSMAYPYNHLLEGLVVGDVENAIPDTINDSFRKAGITHILVVSGSQIALITGMTVLIMKRFTRRKLILFLVINFTNFIFVIISGSDPSVVRAGIMMSIAQLAILFSKNNKPEHSLFLTGSIMISYNPNYVLDLGFILSFLATFSLLSLAPQIEKHLSFIPSKYVRQLFSVTLAPHLMTTPVLLYYFSTYSLFSIFVNILVLPIVEWIVYLAFISIPLFFLSSGLSSILFTGLTVLIQVIMLIVNYFTSVKFSIINIEFGKLSLVFFLYVVLCVVFFDVKKEHKLYLSIIACLLFIISIFPDYREQLENKTIQSGSLSFYVLDVGNGLCTYLRTPSGRSILFDCGGNPEKYVAKSSILPFLQKHGVNGLDYVVISHAHADHYCAINSIEKNIHIKNLILSTFQSKDEVFEKSISDVRKDNVKVIRVGKGDSVTIDGILIKFLAPAKTNFITYVEDDALNNLSLVVGIYYKETEILFTGDVEEDGVMKLLEWLPLASMDIIIVPHHGAKNNSFDKLLSRVNPKLALVSVGKKNKYGHPNRNMLRCIEKYGVKLLRTDINGTIQLKTDGHRIITYARH